MATKVPGGRLGGLHAGTFDYQGDTPLVRGEWVHVTDNYTVAKADGTKPVVGHVSVEQRNWVNHNLTYGGKGDVTVELRGLAIVTGKASGAVAAGAYVDADANGKVKSAASKSVATVGIAMTATTGADQKIDYLVVTA